MIQGMPFPYKSKEQKHKNQIRSTKHYSGFTGLHHQMVQGMPFPYQSKEQKTKIRWKTKHYYPGLHGATNGLDAVYLWAPKLFFLVETTNHMHPTPVSWCSSVLSIFPREYLWYRGNKRRYLYCLPIQIPELQLRIHNIVFKMQFKIKIDIFLRHQLRLSINYPTK